MEKGYLSPVEVSKYIITASVTKANLTTLNTLLLAIMAGAYIGLGAFGYILVGQTIGGFDVGIMKLLGASVFPVGLMLVMFTGSELFTGDTMMTMAVMDKRISFSNMMRTLVLVYLGNLIGSVILAYVIVKAGMINGPVQDYVTKIATGKLGIGFGAGVMRGVLCNILVVMGVWFAYAAQDISSKVWGIWFPVMLFVLAGFEHSVANMFFLPLAKFSGMDFTWMSMWTDNIVPVTIGNIIAGSIIIPLVYYTAHIRPLKD
nr:formate/nitrite transporter family protein [Tissierella sp.]